MQKNVPHLIFLFLTCILQPYFAQANDTLQIDNTFLQADFENFGFLYQSDQTEIDISKIIQIPEADFLPLAATGLSFPPQTKVHWVKSKLQNKTDQVKHLILEVSNPRMNLLQLFTIDQNDSLVTSIQTGDNFLFHQRAIAHRNFLFEIKLLPQQSLTTYLYANKFGENIRLYFKLYDRNFFFEQDRTEIFLLSMLIGFLLCFCLLAITYALLVREASYFWFSIYCFLITLSTVSWTGLGFKYLWFNFPLLNSTLGYTIAGSCAIVMLLLIKTFFKTSTQHVYINKLLIGLVVIVALFIPIIQVYKFFPPHYIQFITNLGLLVQVTYTLTLILVPLISYYQYRQKDALLFLLGFAFVFLFTMVHLLENADILEGTFLTRYAVTFGFLLDIFVLTIVLFRQMKQTLSSNYELELHLNQVKLESANALIKGQQQERQRLSEQLHDGVSTALAYLRMRLSSLTYDLKEEENKRKLEPLVEAVGKIATDVRSFSHALVPFNLKHQSFHEAVEDLVETANDAVPSVNVSLDDSEFSEPTLQDFQSHNLYFCLQELVFNAVKHADAHQIWIRIYENYLGLNIEVKDDGKGFDFNQSTEGIGLKNVRARADLLNAQFVVENCQTGSSFSLILPL